MTAQTIQRLAGRLGYGLGDVRVFFFQDQNLQHYDGSSVVLSSSWSPCWWSEL